MYRMPPGFGPPGMGPISQFGQMMPFRGGGLPAGRSLGFLSRFLSPNPGAGSGLNLIGMVENVQKVMKMADTVKPLVQQYGPMVKNLPSMLQLLKEYQNYSSDSDSEEEDSSTEEKEAKPEQKKRRRRSTTGTKPVRGKKSSGKKSSGRTKASQSTSSEVTNQKETSSKSPNKETKNTKITKTVTNKKVPQVKRIQSTPTGQNRNSVPKLYI
ncbi:VrrA/YqfQ family protein [Pseudalkalibacillus sp. Hm43]|uniref:VrrA/YqfQ family protein n=1 Tax=Pseudalkalibacillus sp. Hm43 TaxID=3450742 RepID=UPI003F43D69F